MTSLLLYFKSPCLSLFQEAETKKEAKEQAEEKRKKEKAEGETQKKEEKHELENPHLKPSKKHR